MNVVKKIIYHILQKLSFIFIWAAWMALSVFVGNFTDSVILILPIIIFIVAFMIITAHDTWMYFENKLENIRKKKS